MAQEELEEEELRAGELDPAAVPVDLERERIELEIGEAEPSSLAALLSSARTRASSSGSANGLVR